MSSKLAHIADEYFSSINPIATKIKQDINEITNAYEHLWIEFSDSEQSDVINETLIKPEIVLKYFDALLATNQHRNIDDDDVSVNISFLYNYLYDGKHISTYSKVKTGLKQNQDDVCGLYRDEHSLPFCVKTKSQINLNLFDLDQNNVIPNPVVLDKLKLRPKPRLDEKQHFPAQVISVEKAELPLLIFANENQPNKGNFLTKLISFNNTISATTGGRKHNRVNEDEENLVANISLGMQSSSSVPSEEEDDKNNFGEFSSLLENNELKKGYDFLNNW